MMDESKFSIKLGYAPTRRDIFSRENAILYNKKIEDKLKSWNVNLVNIDWLNSDALLFDSNDVEKVKKRFEAEKVDAVFSPHCNFGTEDAVAKLAKAMGKPFLLWGPRDEAPLDNGLRLRDSQCGLFATSKVLQRFGIPFTYITNSRVESDTFKNGFDNFIRAASVVKAFRSMKIGQIGTRPDSFWSVKINEAQLLERFGIEIIPITLVEIISMTKKNLATRKDEVGETAAGIKAITDCSAVDYEMIERMAALKIAIREWADANGCSAIAIQCWNALQDSLGIMPCVINAELTDSGLPVACETDIYGAITTVILQAARMGESPVFFADLTIRHPDNENAELLWHCGPFPPSLKREGTKGVMGNHYVLDSGCPGVAEWEIKHGDISLARFDEIDGNYSLLMGEGRGIEGPKTRGTYVWFEVDNWPKWENKLIRGPYIHHVAGIHGKAAHALYEACRYIPGLSPDPVEPDAEKICNSFEGGV